MGPTFKMPLQPQAGAQRCLRPVSRQHSFLLRNENFKYQWNRGCYDCSLTVPQEEKSVAAINQVTLKNTGLEPPDYSVVKLLQTAHRFLIPYSSFHYAAVEPEGIGLRMSRKTDTQIEV